MDAPIIDMHGIVKRFPIGTGEELEVLHGIDLTVRKGEFVAIVGASGSGKSTLMNIIGALDRPTEGTYVLDGVDVGTLRDKQLSRIRCRKIGFVFQTFNLVPRTSALKNVALPMMYNGVRGTARTQRARALLDMVEMGDRAGHAPSQLSGGLAHKALGNIGHHVHGLPAENFRRSGYLSPSQEGHTLFAHNNLKHLHGLAADQFILGEEKHTHAIRSLVSYLKAQVFSHLLKKSVGNLEHDTHAVSCLALSVFSCPVFQIFNNMKGLVHCAVAPYPLYIGHCADAAVIMLKTWFIQSWLFLFGFHRSFFLSL